MTPRGTAANATGTRFSSALNTPICRPAASNMTERSSTGDRSGTEAVDLCAVARVTICGSPAMTNDEVTTPANKTETTYRKTRRTASGTIPGATVRPMFTRPFRFGVQATQATSRAQWQDLARRTEALGYSVLTMPDHVGTQLAPIPALMAAADATTTLRLGPLVLDNDFRHPLVLAKELATLDVLSDGRLEIGLGAGWDRADYEQTGIP